MTPDAITNPVPPRDETTPYGAPAYYREDPRFKSPLVATVLSLMPGLGQVYLGYIQQGLTYFGIVAVLITILASDPGALTPFFGLSLAFCWLFNFVDANRRAHLLNLITAGLPPGELPQDLLMANFKGSVLGGLALIVIGGITLAHLRFGLPLAWLEHWWPVAVIALGVHLVWKAAKKG